MQEIELIDWKPNELKFCIKMVLLSHDELTMVKQEEVIHSSKVRGLCISPRKVGGLSPPPASVAYGVDCELSLVCSKIVETNFKNDEHSAPYR